MNNAAPDLDDGKLELELYLLTTYMIEWDQLV